MCCKYLANRGPASSLPSSCGVMTTPIIKAVKHLLPNAYNIKASVFCQKRNCCKTNTVKYCHFCKRSVMYIGACVERAVSQIHCVLANLHHYGGHVAISNNHCLYDGALKAFVPWLNWMSYSCLLQHKHPVWLHM